MGGLPGAPASLSEWGKLSKLEGEDAGAPGSAPSIELSHWHGMELNRTVLTLLTAAAVLAPDALDGANPSAGSNTESSGRSRMKLLSKEVFIRRQNNRPPVTGFITYISKTK